MTLPRWWLFVELVFLAGATLAVLLPRGPDAAVLLLSLAWIFGLTLLVALGRLARRVWRWSRRSLYAAKR